VSSEQEELNRAIELLGRKTRPGRLLEFIGTKYFQHQVDQLSEHVIAIEVFGRSAKTFDATEDAVVRVEMHRLRKKLRELYAQGGGPGGLQISLPTGAYVLKFSPAATPATAVSNGDAHAATAEPDEHASEEVGTRRLSKPAIYLVALLVIAAVAVGIVLMRADDGQRAAQTPSGSAAMPPTGPADDKPDEVHIIAGYTGSEVIDSSGVRWTPDRYFSGGGAWPTGRGHVRGTTRQFLFTTWRNGQFSYDVPLKPGTYEMRLYFVSPHAIGDEKISGFEVSMNGKSLLTAFDVNISAHGPDVAEEKVFKDVSPGEDGFVHLGFANQVGIPSLNALEFTPGTPGKLRPIRISTQPTSFVDHKGQRWRADDYFINGFRSTERRKVSGTEDPELFVSERYGHFRYAIPVDTRGRYTVVLHFAEFYFGAQMPGGGGNGSRVFNVFCNGQTLLKDFDIHKEAGSLRLVSKTFSNIQPSAQGKINLTFEPVSNNASVSAIEVLDESPETR
jgi:hypothetical protein